MVKALLMAAGGVLLIVLGLVMHLAERRVRRKARPVPAMVVDSGSSRVGDGRMAWVRYRYTVDGKEYQSSRVYPPAAMQTRGGFSHVRRILRRYPKGSRVTAHYFPQKPESAFLENRFEWLHAVPFVLGLALLLLAMDSI